MKSLCMIFLLSINVTLHAETSECYVTSFMLKDMSSAEDKWYEATSHMKVLKNNDTHIEF